jgi:uncharacterized protein YndB with AHSA1/START domain
MNLTDTLNITTLSDTEIQMSRTFAAPRELVFQACTDPRYVAQWMLGPEDWTMPVCEVDLRPGGSWHFVWRKGNGKEMSMTGQYKEVEPPARIVLTENWGGDWPETTNTLVFTEKDGLTTYSATILYPSKAARDAATQTGMTQGAAMSFDRLEKVLAAL